MRNWLKYYTCTIAKFLLTISLFANIFVFSSSAENISLWPEQTAQTELVVADENRIHKRIFSYKKVLTQLIRNKYLNVFWIANIDAARVLDNFNKVKFERLTKLFNSYRIIFLSNSKKILPQNPSEDLILC